MARTRSLGERVRAALVVGSITLGILLLLALQFVVPYWLGTAGLLVVGLLDAAIYLELRHHRAVRQRARAGHRPSGNLGGRYPAVMTAHPVKDENVATIALLVFIVGLFVQGLGLRIINPAYPPATTNDLLWWGGYAVVNIAFLMLSPIRWRRYDLRSESEKYDTTDDH